MRVGPRRSWPEAVVAAVFSRSWFDVHLAKVTARHSKAARHIKAVSVRTAVLRIRYLLSVIARHL